MKKYKRINLYNRLVKQITGRTNLIQAVVGPRQVGKTTLVKQVKDAWKGLSVYETADLQGVNDTKWLIEVWKKARRIVKKEKREVLLIVDEIQKVPGWSSAIKKMFDEDKYSGTKLRVIILGSSSLLMQRGLSESLAGRFELHKHNHWSFSECSDYFKVKLDEYLFFGGYPAGVPLRKELNRWKTFIREALIETVISKDVLLLNPVTKPVLLRQALSLCFNYPAQILSYQKMIGQLNDAGNAATIKHYLQLLSNAFFLVPLERYSGSKIKQKSSSPKLIFMDNSTLTANMENSFKGALSDKQAWGRLVENAVGAKLQELAWDTGNELFYWRDRSDEMDFVFKTGKRIIGIEVKSGSANKAPNNISLFLRRYKKATCVIISKDGKTSDNCSGLELNDFFKDPKEIMNI